MIKADSVNDVLNKIKQDFENRKRSSHIIMIEDSLNHVLASDIVSKISIPGFDRAEIEGYALNHESLYGADYYDPISLDISGLDEIEMNEAKYVISGEALPSGADCVIDIEYVKEKDKSIWVNREIAKGHGVSFKGSKIKSGDVVLKKDTKLNPLNIGLLASLNEFMVEVYKKVKVGVISFGEDITTVRTPEKDKDIDLNSYILSSELENKNVISIPYGITDKKSSAEVLEKACSECDIVTVLVSSSFNYAEIFGENKVYSDEILISPGEDTLIINHNDTPVFFLNGNPKDVYLLYNVFVKPVIDIFLNIEENEPYIKARSIYNVPSKKGINEYKPVSIEKKDGGYYFEIIENDSLMSEFLSSTDGYILIPKDKDEIRKDESVKVTLV